MKMSEYAQLHDPKLTAHGARQYTSGVTIVHAGPVGFTGELELDNGSTLQVGPGDVIVRMPNSPKTMAILPRDLAGVLLQPITAPE